MGIGSGMTVGILLVGLAALAAIVVVLVLVMRKGGRRDWAEPMAPPGRTDRAAYGAGAPDYPTAPPPAQTRQPGEHDWPDPEPGEPPTRIDDSQQFREQNRLDDPPKE